MWAYTLFIIVLRLYFQGNGEPRLKIHAILWDFTQPYFKQNAILDPVTEALYST